MTKILFVCLGNICRSPMAEYVMKDLAAKAGREAEFQIASVGTESFNNGKPVYPDAAKILAEHGISSRGKTARQLQKKDYDAYDFLIGMDEENLFHMRRICGGDSRDKFHLLMEFTNRPGDVADPWYTGDFETAWRDIEEGCRGLLDWLTDHEKSYPASFCQE